MRRSIRVVRASPHGYRAPMLAALWACAPKGPPDVLVVSLDTLRADRLGAYGGPPGLTPNLDRFASEGVTFLRAYSQGTFTAPSHASLFTSRYPPELVRTGRHPAVGGDKPTLAEVLGAYGYETGAFVAGGDLAPEIGLDVGFDVYESPRDFGSLFHTAPPALAWIDARPADTPWLAFVHSYDTHSPYRRPPPLGSLVSDPERKGPGGEALRTQMARVADGFLMHDLRPFLFIDGTWARPRSPAGRAELAQVLAGDPSVPRLDEADLAQIRGAYDGAVAYADARFGLLLAQLDRRGVLDDSVVVVLSDHGEGMHEAGVFNHCCQVDDATTHVPLLVRLPGGERGGAKVDAIVELTDVAPTLYELAGAQAPAGARGVSFAAALRGEPFAGREVAWTTGSDGMRMTSGRSRDGRLTWSGTPPWAPGLADLLAAAALPGPGFVVEGTIDAERARGEMASFVRSLKTLPPTDARPVSPRLERELREHGYWGSP